jgi:hypothetical protein
MVKLCSDEFEQVTMLELLLHQYEIPFEFELTEVSYGLTPPFLIVDGVPLDFDRALKWIKGRYENE